MNSSIENILNYIEKNTEKEIEEIKQNCLLKINEIKEKTKIEIEKNSKETEEKIKMKKEEIKKIFDVKLNQIQNRYFMQKKEEILKEVIDKAFYVFCEEDEERYIKFILNILYKNLPKTNSTIFLGKRDYYRLKSHILQNNLQIEETSDFDYGFKIENDRYVLNFNLKEIFTQNTEKLKKIASNKLNIKDVLT